MKKLAFLLLTFFILSCDKGLAPPGVTSISGTVHFIGTPKDSVKILAIVLVQPPPLYTDSILINGLNTTVLPFLLSPDPLRDTSFTIGVKPDTVYHYLGIAQNYGNLFTDWKVIAFAHDEKDSALTFTLRSGERRSGVDLVVRFDSLPRQPFIK
ncbi:MAG: hypothetical protein Q8916_02960 [Bacteroidota bacterium]|nr:hypothetical protein [Bacteroidota bacterium]MDP4229347.1 hypothetical protein [Bacteroidota bacterium]MDP4237207.1 hypothetical protein [Bacteroidota bacterium]